VQCRHYELGEGGCPFGVNCFYAHKAAVRHCLCVNRPLCPSLRVYIFCGLIAFRSQPGQTQEDVRRYVGGDGAVRVRSGIKLAHFL